MSAEFIRHLRERIPSEPDLRRARLLPRRNFSVGQEPDPPNYSLISTLFKPFDLTIAFAVCFSDWLNLRDNALSLHAFQSGT